MAYFMQDGTYINSTNITINVLDADDQGNVFTALVYNVDLLEGDYLNVRLLFNVLVISIASSFQFTQHFVKNLFYRTWIILQFD